MPSTVNAAATNVSSVSKTTNQGAAPLDLTENVDYSGIDPRQLAQIMSGGQQGPADPYSQYVSLSNINDLVAMAMQGPPPPAPAGVPITQQDMAVMNNFMTSIGAEPFDVRMVNSSSPGITSGSLFGAVPNTATAQPPAADAKPANS